MVVKRTAVDDEEIVMSYLTRVCSADGIARRIKFLCAVCVCFQLSLYLSLY